jgi:hypothetical protein
MPTWSIYYQADGLFTGRVFMGPESDLAANVPPGQAALAGHWSHLQHRVSGGAAVPYQPPAPAGTEDVAYTWSISQTKWLATLTPSGEVRASNKQIQAQIEAAEMASLRAMREVLLASSSANAGSPSAVALAATEAEVVLLRAQLQSEA